jgi:zinc transport system ATP-binding protein
VTASAATAPVVEVEGLTFGFDPARPVLKEATFRVEPLDFASVIGPNGGGKTTLLKLLLGLLQPDRGAVRVLGTSPQKARQRVGYMPQHATIDPRFPIDVMDVVLMGRLNATRAFGPYARRDRAAARSALEHAGLAGFERRPIAALSGGERQRVLVARALAAEPELLLLDEPAAGLDQRVEHDFFQLLVELNRRMTIILVSHDLGFVSRYVRTVICVNRTVQVHPTSAVNGRVIADMYGGEVRLVHHEHAEH